MASYIVQETELTAIASAIRTKSGISNAMTVAEMPTKINQIKAGASGTDTSGDTVTPETLIAGYTAHDASGEPITGVNPYELTSTNATVDEQADLIAQIQTALESKTAAGDADPVLQEKTVTPTTSSQSVTPDNDYDGLSKVTVNAIPNTYVKPTSTKAATTYTPTTSNQTISAGTYCSGAQTIKGDANLVAGNIKSGVSIFGVAGSYEGSGGGGSVETCTVELPTNRYFTIYAISYMTVDDNGKIVYACITPNSTATQTITCLCNSIIAMSHSSSDGVIGDNPGKYNVLCSRPYFDTIGLLASPQDNIEIIIDISYTGGAG